LRANAVSAAISCMRNAIPATKIIMQTQKKLPRKSAGEFFGATVYKKFIKNS